MQRAQLNIYWRMLHRWTFCRRQAPERYPHRQSKESSQSPANTPEGKDFTTEDIDRWHRQQGFSSIGYHFVVYRDGSVHTGRPIEQVGAHCRGRNSTSIGVCYIGGLSADGKRPKDTRTDNQKKALKALLTLLKLRFPDAEIRGHRDYAAKACPSFDATFEYKNL